MENSSRLLKELREIESDKRSGVSVELVDGKLTHMTGTIQGATATPTPRDAGRVVQVATHTLTQSGPLPPCAPLRLVGPDSSPYEGGTFRIDIRLPSDCALVGCVARVACGRVCHRGRVSTHALS